MFFKWRKIKRELARPKLHSSPSFLGNALFETFLFDFVLSSEWREFLAPELKVKIAHNGRTKRPTAENKQSRKSAY